MATNNLPAIKNVVLNQAVQKSIKDRIGEKAGTFSTSIIDLMGEDKVLGQCDPNLVIKEGLKAAALDLPINKNLGFAYVLPYKGVPQFQMGYKGYIQLAIRTGLYKHINADVVYEGEEMIVDRIRGTLEVIGQAKSDKVIGVFASFELLNGFQKAIGWSVEKIKNHGKKYSKSYTSKYSPWQSDPESMFKKTMIMQLIPKFGPMTIEMSQAMSIDRGDFQGFDDSVEQEVSNNANQEYIDVKSSPVDNEDISEITDDEKAEIEAEEAASVKKDF